MPQFEPICLTGQDAYRALLGKNPGRASDYSFVNVWGWRDMYGLEWAFEDDLVWLRQTRPETAYWAPVGRLAGRDWAGLAFPEGARRFIRVPEELALAWRDGLGAEVNEAREHFDYLYSIEELVELKGNRFHKKKNLLGQFQKAYNHVYQPLTPDCVEEAIEMQERWCAARGCESEETLAAENEAIIRVLQSWDRLTGLLGGAIHVDGEMAAYTVAEILTPDTIVIHFEKGQTRFKGIYQAMNQMFLANAGLGYRYVNREQDLGEEGLRKAKLSYNPVDFVKKYEVVLK